MAIYKIVSSEESEEGLTLVFNESAFPQKTTTINLTHAAQAAAILIQLLAKIAGDYLGSQSEKKILNAKFDSLRDQIAEMVQKAVEEIEGFIVQAIDQNTIKECQARIDSAVTLIREFENEPRDGKYRLDNADTAASYVVYRLIPFGSSVILPFVDAISIRMTVLAIRMRTLQSQGEQRNILNLYNTAHDYIEKWSLELLHLWETKCAGVSSVQKWEFAPTKCSRGDESCTPSPKLFLASWYDNGVEKRYESEKDEVWHWADVDREARYQTYANKLDQLKKQIIAPVSQAEASWRALIDKAMDEFQLTNSIELK
jgi:hypothetical protein